MLAARQSSGLAGGVTWMKSAPSTTVAPSLRNSQAIANGSASRYASLHVSDADFNEVDIPVATATMSSELQYEFNNCVGLRTKLSGTAQITAAVTSVNVSLSGLLDIYLAGTNQSQLVQQINVHPTGDTASGTKWWITAGGDNTSFNINVSAVATTTQLTITPASNMASGGVIDVICFGRAAA